MKPISTEAAQTAATLAEGIAQHFATARDAFAEVITEEGAAALRDGLGRQRRRIEAINETAREALAGLPAEDKLRAVIETAAAQIETAARAQGAEAEKEARRHYGYANYATAQTILQIEQPAAAAQWKETARAIMANPDPDREFLGERDAARLSLEDALKEEFRDIAEEAKEDADPFAAVMIEAGFCEISFQEVAAHILDLIEVEDRDAQEDAEEDRPRVEVAYTSPTFGPFVIRWQGGHTIRVQDEGGQDVTVWTTYGEGADEPTEDEIRASIERQTTPGETEEGETVPPYIEELIRGEIAAR